MCVHFVGEIIREPTQLFAADDKAGPERLCVESIESRVARESELAARWTERSINMAMTTQIYICH